MGGEEREEKGGCGGGRGSEMEVCVPVHVAPPPIACAGCQARLLVLRPHSRACTSDPARAVGAPTPGEVLRGVRQKAVGARLVACTGPFRASADAAPPGRGRARGRGRGGPEAAPLPFASKPRRYPSKYLRNFSRAKRLFSRARRSRPRAGGGAVTRARSDGDPRRPRVSNTLSSGPQRRHGRGGARRVPSPCSFPQRGFCRRARPPKNGAVGVSSKIRRRRGCSDALCAKPLYPRWRQRADRACRPP